MTLLRCFFITLFLVLTHTVMAQEDDLDAIFDDGDKTEGFDVAVGSDFLTFIGGTPNIYGELTLKDKFGGQFGVGIVPFGFLLGVSNPGTLLDPEESILDRDIKGGFFTNIALKYKVSYRSFSYYYYGEFKKWWVNYDPVVNPSEFESVAISMKRTKLNFGLGYSLDPFPNIGFDAHTGIFMGITNTTTTNSSVILPAIGFDLGLGMYYKF